MALSDVRANRVGSTIVKKGGIVKRPVVGKPLLLFADNPGAYMGKSEPIAKPKQGVKSSWAAKYAKIAPKYEKPVLPTGYNPELIHRIEAIPNFDFTPNDISADSIPILKYLNVGDLLIDHNWQRTLTGTDLAMLRQICEDFQWAEFKAVNVMIVVDAERQPQFYVTNGQKSSYAALHRGINKIPCICTIASEHDRIKLMAKSFVSLNTQQVPIPQSDLFTAQHFAGDPIARGTAEILLKHRIQIVRPKTVKDSEFGYRQTHMVGTLKGVYARLGAATLDRLVKLMGNANFRPIRTHHVWALLRLIKEREFKDAQMIAALNVELDVHVLNAARVRAHKKGESLPVALSDIYWEKYTKQLPVL